MNMRLKTLKRHLFFCCSTHCNNQDAEGVMEAFKEELVKHGLHKEVKLNKTSCLGLCGNGVFVLVYPEGVWYYALTPEDVPQIVQEHFIDGDIVEEKVMMKLQA
ncbi:(2Fe-2S) ferredoxin domain-containing protein [Gorillibacterium massiliense]|uniref:(2Fe-2S) ferredoxin domain-containing protein n=1 Tax=Gorillibacterium massiliense TaxID=1280390 RepID=UPI0004AF6A97|nr:(2Fe-2S) ferredoxin domain-containing protein [Gorillibacterium massiliense]